MLKHVRFRIESKLIFSLVILFSVSRWLRGVHLSAFLVTFKSNIYAFWRNFFSVVQLCFVARKNTVTSATTTNLNLKIILSKMFKHLLISIPKSVMEFQNLRAILFFFQPRVRNFIIKSTLILNIIIRSSPPFFLMSPKTLPISIVLNSKEYSLFCRTKCWYLMSFSSSSLSEINKTILSTKIS